MPKHLKVNVENLTETNLVKLQVTQKLWRPIMSELLFKPN